MTSSKLSWAPIIPLIGGFPLGAEEATGTPPQFVSSYSGFWNNDKHYMNYQNNTLGRSVEYRNLTESRVKEKLDLVIATPPCAGLSQLNTGKSPEVSGSGCAQNEWLYQCARDAIDLYEPEVFIAENAPALYTETGSPVAENLRAIAHSSGYSISFYKTSTHLHGIPQQRDRTFVLFFKASQSPILSWYHRPRRTFYEFISNLDKSDINQDVFNDNLMDEPWFAYLQDRYHGEARHTIMNSRWKTAFKYVRENGLITSAIQFFETSENESGLEQALYAKSKLDKGLNIWDKSIHVFSDMSNAVIGRNLLRTIHPVEDRSLSVHESLSLMGFPFNFEVEGGRKRMHIISQNVPVCTARDMVFEAMKFINGQLNNSGSNHTKQNNITGETNVIGDTHTSLENFI